MLIIVIITGMFLLTVIMSLSTLMTLKLKKKQEKQSVFECGFDPDHKTRSSFSLRFFIVSVVFLIFDMEIAIILPTPLLTLSTPSNHLLLSNMFIILLLGGGLIYEWMEGALEWQ